MAEVRSKVPVKIEKTPARGSSLQAWRPFDGLHREIDRLFEDFDREFWRSPFRRSMFDVEPSLIRTSAWVAEPAVDISESDQAFEIKMELPGMDEKDVEVKLANGGLTISGEKQEQKEEREKDYYLKERHFGSFERYFRLPDGVNADKIEASSRKGVLTITLPKNPEAQKAAKKIEVKTA